jgi:hypothetical protein
LKDENPSIFDDKEHLLQKTKAYVDACRASAEGSKGKGRFPNLAGLCLALGLGIETFEREMEARPNIRDVVCALLEDEAINFDPSTTIISTYLKKRLGYGEKKTDKRTSCEAGDLHLVFEHDIYEDGGS